LKTFFAVVGKDAVEVVTADIFDFIADQRSDRTVVRISDGESGLSARTIARRLSSISRFYAYLVARGDTPVTANPVPRGLSTRRQGEKRHQVPLVRVPRTLPKILSPGEVKETPSSAVPVSKFSGIGSITAHPKPSAHLR
jgi:site-specific recombinase XerC